MLCRHRFHLQWSRWHNICNCYFRPVSVSSGSDFCSPQSASGSDAFQGGDLTWAILTNACPNLIYGGCADSSWIDGDEHDMETDLVWDKDPNCGECPRCPCNQGDPTEYNLYNYTTFDTSSAFSVSVCYECQCSFFYNDGGYVYGRICTTGQPELLTFNSPEELANIECPYTTPSPTKAPTGGMICYLFHC